MASATVAVNFVAHSQDFERNVNKAANSLNSFLRTAKRTMKLGGSIMVAEMGMDFATQFSKAMRSGDWSTFGDNIPVIGALSKSIAGLIEELTGLSAAMEEVDKRAQAIDKASAIFSTINATMSKYQDEAKIAAAPADQQAGLRKQIELQAALDEMYEDLQKMQQTEGYSTKGVTQYNATADAMQKILDASKAEALKKQHAPIDAITKGLSDQYLELTRTGEEWLIYQLSVKGASYAEMEAATKTYRMVDALKKQNAAMDELTSFTKQMTDLTKTPSELFTENTTKLLEAFQSGDMSEDVMTRSMKVFVEQYVGSEFERSGGSAEALNPNRISFGGYDTTQNAQNRIASLTETFTGYLKEIAANTKNSPLPK